MMDAISQATDCARNGNFDEARRLAEANLEQHPNDAGTLHLLGLLDDLAGSTALAIERIHRAIELDSNIANYHSDLGLALFKLDRLSEAEQALRRALALDPHHHIAAYNLALVLNYQNRHPEALSILSPFGDGKDLSGETDLLLGILYRRVSRAELALVHAQKSVKLNQENPEAWALCADLHEQFQQLKDAQNCLNQGLALAPSLPTLLLNKARLLSREKKFEDVANTISSVHMDRVPHSLAANLLNEWGNSLDRLNHPAEAMEKFAAAKKRQSLSEPDMSEAAAAYLRSIEDALLFDYSVLTSQEIPETDPEPIFLIAFPRSGTTLLDQILDSHSSIQTLEEKPLITEIVETHPELFKPIDNRIVPLPSDTRNELQQIYFKHAARHVEIAPNNVWVDKFPLNIIRVHQILQIFPRARFILALRHPCDVVLSCQMHLFGLNAAMVHFQTLEGTARLYAKVMQLWKTFAQNLLPKHHVIRYEDLVSHFDKEVESLLAFLDLPWEENVRKYNEHAQNRGFINTPSYVQVVEPLYTRASGRWMRYINELKPVLPVLEPAIQGLGYDYPAN